MPLVLTVEDDDSFCRMLRRILGRLPDMHTVAAGSCAEAERRLGAEVFDLVLLDLRLPDGHGLHLLSRLRRKGILVPVAVLSGVDDALTTVEALRAGADDFLFKSRLAPDELVARVEAILRRGRTARTSCSWGDLDVDLAAGRATVRGEAVALTPTQLRLVIALVLRAPEAVARDDLAAIGWSGGPSPSRGSFDNQILALRRVLEPFGLGLSVHHAAAFALIRLDASATATSM